MQKYKIYNSKLNNLNLIKNRNLKCQPNLLRFLSNSSSSSSSTVISEASDLNSFSSREWLTAKPFTEIPTMNTFDVIKNFIPGGKYYKCDSTEFLLALKRDFGDICKLPGSFGQTDMIVTHNVQDFETLLRNEGIWPKRPGLEALVYLRSVYRKDFFQGTEGLLATHGKQWGSFRSIVNPVLMQPKNVRFYLGKMSQVNKEFIERHIHLPATKKIILRSYNSLTLQDTKLATTNINADWLNSKSYKEIPSMSVFSLIKNFLPGGKYHNLDSSEFILALKRELGNIYKLKGIFGRPDVIYTHNIEDFEKVVRNEGIWPKRPGFLTINYHRKIHRPDYFQGVTGLLVTHDEEWGTFRSLVNPILMQRRNVELYLEKMSQVNKEFIERIRQIRDPLTLEVPNTFEEEINRWTLESVSVVALDKKLGLINENRENPMAKQMFATLNEFISLSLDIELKPSIWRYYKTPTFKRLMISLDTILEITTHHINEAIQRLEEERQRGVPEKTENKKSVLEKLLKIDKKIATVMAMDMLMAGVDTSSSAFAGILLALAKNPVKQAKLREEVLKILPHKDSEFTEESYKNMPYLRACIKEALRVYPLTVGNSRAPARDVVLSGYKVPKGTRVTMVSIALLKDEQHFAKAKEYLPERWLRIPKEQQSPPAGLKPSCPFVYLPFGFGPRTCIGRRIVEMELELGIARLVRNFHIEFNYSTDNAFKSVLMNVPNIPLNFKFIDVVRCQSTLHSNIDRKEPPNSLQHEWEKAKPFEEIPSLNKFSGFISFLPGGKYYKLDPNKLLLALKRDLGNIIKFKGYFGRKDLVITHNVDDFITVFRNEGKWPVRPGLDFFAYHRTVHRADFFEGVEGIISTHGEKWANFRSVVNPILMQPKNARLYMHKMSQVNKELVERIRQIRDPKTLEVPATFEDDLNRWTLESISVVALDKQLGLINKNRNDSLVKELFQAITGFFQYGMEVEYQLPFWKIVKTKSFKNLMKSLDSMLNIANIYVNEAIKRIEQEEEKRENEKPEHEKSVLEKLIKIDKKIATVMAMDMLTAGVDTTSSAFVGLLLCLAKNPQKQAKLREEVMRILPQKDSEFSEESTRNMPYLRACIKEALRIYPVVIANIREPANDVVLSGYRVPKGTQVSMVLTDLIRDDNHFPRAKEFLPERWLRIEEQKQNIDSSECPHALKPSSPFVYLPFGFGPRSCIGRRIVEMELELGIARVIRNFQVEFNYPTENAFKCLLINVPNIPLKFKFSDIQN
ncbi:uncharacterized protein ACRADG_012838 [Cochliomyia hominivorax]